LHRTFCGKYGTRVACPRAPGNPVVDIPVKHRLQTVLSGFGAIEQHAKSAVDDFAPTDATAVVEAYPGGAAKTVADHILNGHIGGVFTAVIDIGGFAERGVCARDVVMIASEHYRADLAFFDRLVEGLGNFDAAFGIGIENT